MQDQLQTNANETVCNKNLGMWNGNQTTATLIFPLEKTV
jgi:hypothetical protein